MENTTTPSANAPRLPTAEERQLLSNWLRDQGYEAQEADGTAADAYIAVYDEYCTGGPGYIGKLMSVVWDGSPSFFDVFIWRANQFTRCGRDYDDSPGGSLSAAAPNLLEVLEEMVERYGNEILDGYDTDRIAKAKGIIRSAKGL